MGDAPAQQPEVARPAWSVPLALLLMFGGMGSMFVALAALLATTFGGAYLVSEEDAISPLFLGIAFLLSFLTYTPDGSRAIYLFFTVAIIIAAVILAAAESVTGKILLGILLLALLHGWIVSSALIMRRGAILADDNWCRERHLRNGLCPYCLYSTRNLTSPRCPECGNELNAQPRRAPAAPEIASWPERP